MSPKLGEGVVSKNWELKITPPLPSQKIMPNVNVEAHFLDASPMIRCGSGCERISKLLRDLT